MNSEKMRVEQKTATKNSIVRLLFVVLLIALQFVWIYYLITFLESHVPWLSTVITSGALVLALTISARHMNASYRMFWIIMVLVFPVLGIPFYAIMGRKNSTKRMRVRFEKVDHMLFSRLQQQQEVMERLEKEDLRAAGTSNYLLKTCRFPVYQNTDIQFFPDAALAFESQLKDLKLAEKFIFMEYFAIEKDGAFQRVLEILKRKAEQGVEIRIVYDDIGSISFLDSRFTREMESYGIHCQRFNPVLPFLNIFMNNRDHRKIMVIDGKIGYTGGYNMANEYFHLTQPYGFWKDTGVRLQGDAVRTLTAICMEILGGFKHRDIANKYGVSPSTVSIFKHRLEKEGFYKGIDGCRALSELSESELARRIYPGMIDLKDGDVIIVGRAKPDTYIPDFKEIANEVIDAKVTRKFCFNELIIAH